MSILSLRLRSFVDTSICCGVALICMTAYGDPGETRAAALKSLETFAKEQGWTERYSASMVADITGVEHGREPAHEVETVSISRDGDLLNISGSCDFFGVHDPYRFRLTVGRDLAIRYEATLTSPPHSATVYNLDDLRAQYFSWPHVAALDGYLPCGNRRRINETMEGAIDLRMEAPEEVNGALCEVVAATTPYGRIQIWLDPNKSHVIRKATISKGADDIHANGKPLSQTPEYQGQRWLGWSAEIADVEVKQFKDVHIPVNGRMVVEYELSGGRNRYAVAYDRTCIELSPDFAHSNPFLIDLPDGTLLTYIGRPELGNDIWKDNKVVKREKSSKYSPQQIQSIKLDAAKLASLEGQPAPEILGIVAWKNGEPVTLAALRGQCVLLEFWGYWCGPCVSRMPKLFELHDKYHEQGLVIIGVHVDVGEDEEDRVNTATKADDRVNTALKLDDRLSDARKKLWGVRDIPFLVALTSGDRTDLENGRQRTARSPAAATYGIRSYPTQVLVDRGGKVVRTEFVPDDKGIKLLEKSLQAK